MATRGRPRGKPAYTPEDRDNQLIARAVDLAERQLIDGTASAQVMTHYLKQASPRERLELQRLRQENALLEAKVEQLKSAKRVEELYENALNAMRAYAGHEPMPEDDGYDDQDVY
jgi:hypothetical protein